MAKLIILRGLPASGKSTWARSWCEDPANTWPHCVISGLSLFGVGGSVRW